MTPKLCECGCGSIAARATRSSPREGYAKGQYVRFRRGHNKRILWTSSYPGVKREGYRGTMHRYRAELALGKPLPTGAEVHHVDGTKSKTSGLVICQSASYHMLLHARTRIYKAGGNPNTDAICTTCRAVKPLEAFGASAARWNSHSHICKTCSNLYLKKRYARLKAEALCR